MISNVQIAYCILVLHLCYSPSSTFKLTSPNNFQNTDIELTTNKEKSTDDGDFFDKINNKITRWKNLLVGLQNATHDDMYLPGEYGVRNPCYLIMGCVPVIAMYEHLYNDPDGKQVFNCESEDPCDYKDCNKYEKAVVFTVREHCWSTMQYLWQSFKLILS